MGRSSVIHKVTPYLLPVIAAEGQRKRITRKAREHKIIVYTVFYYSMKSYGQIEVSYGKILDECGKETRVCLKL